MSGDQRQLRIPAMYQVIYKRGGGVPHRRIVDEQGRELGDDMRPLVRRSLWRHLIGWLTKGA